MKKLKTLAIYAFLLLIGLGFSFPRVVWALRPMASNFFAFVAGEGTGGFRDGDFASAYFKRPLGLAINTDGTRLYVADSLNNRVRVIYLDQDNLVTTLGGQNKAGNQDGPLASASFNHPHSIVYLPGDRLVVNDFGNKRLRLVDLKSGTVSTLAGKEPSSREDGPAQEISMADIRDMVYLASPDSLLFTQPSLRALKRLDLKTGQVTSVKLTAAQSAPTSLSTPVPVDPTGLVWPTALCVSGDKLYMADHERPMVFQMEWKTDGFSSPSLTATSSGIVLALAARGDQLYALQAGVEAPLERLLPHAEPVSFVSPWGDEISEPGLFLPSFVSSTYEMGPLEPIGFIPDLLDEKKLYIVNPYLNIITSFRDVYDDPNSKYTGDYYNVNGLNDFDYPAHKPPRTFRILLVGDSRSSMIVNYSIKTTFNTQTRDRFPRQLSMAKRMESYLNTLAALEDAPMNFEVLSYPHSASLPLFLWPRYELPNIVSKNDVDLVLILHAPTSPDIFPFRLYFMRPITREGIPSQNTDPEYLLVPPMKRIAAGDPKRFYDLCKSRNLVHIEGNNFMFDNALFSDPDLKDILIQLYGKPLDILNQTLSGMKSTSGKPVSVVLCSVNTGPIAPYPEDKEIWAGVARKLNIPFLDLNKEMTALRLSFYPLTEEGGACHFNHDGHEFFSQLLAHDLIREGLVPWGRDLFSSPMISTPQNP